MAKSDRLTAADVERIRTRKGAQRRSAIPGEVLAALNRGLVPTVNLVEWLAIEPRELLLHAVADAGFDSLTKPLAKAWKDISKLAPMRRHEAIGQALFELPTARDRKRLFAKLSKHTSDVVRVWSNYMLWADRDIELAERLERTRPFAADPHFGVRETAWFSFRDYLIAELERGLALLKPWVLDADPNIRRCATEGSRPRGVWCNQIAVLKEDPNRAVDLLEPCRADPSRYVQLSVGNWLNDASKSRPDWVRELCRRWMLESPTAQTKAIVHRGLRTLEKGKGT